MRLAETIQGVGRIFLGDQLVGTAAYQIEVYRPESERVDSSSNGESLVIKITEESVSLMLGSVYRLEISSHGKQLHFFRTSPSEATAVGQLTSLRQESGSGSLATALRRFFGRK